MAEELYRDTKCVEITTESISEIKVSVWKRKDRPKLTREQRTEKILVPMDNDEDVAVVMVIVVRGNFLHFLQLADEPAPCWCCKKDPSHHVK